ncbi:class I SAM-dependent methyltransferase [Christiangramia sabulilitoris]|uniref:Class I SAM-dependent methyltransferase n=1 Tax=Christiangramia sabulilitoris TaxID=2583991 RepID=A0A550HYY5_9FLAO|nr:class I SAM-dependent methyltransferase [Christiangramia sabulilitoris]TRO63927.1 class I SAM-dependent methyltransferase [Christiangramia sabulilitoris]
MCLNKEEINNAPYLFDISSRIILKNNKVYRIIENKEKIFDLKSLLEDKILKNLYDAGLVNSEIIYNDKEYMVVEHETIPFILHPCEYTDLMFWKAAKMFVNLNLELYKSGFITHDSHPWNISFFGKKPVFYDLGSILRGNEVSMGWFNEFFYFFMVPITLASKKRTRKFSKEYRREHKIGFGRTLFKSKKIEDIFFRRSRSISKFRSNPETFFKELLDWLESHKPIKPLPKYWSNYYQPSGMDFKIPKTIKEKFVYKILKNEMPENVLDLASNKGYFAYLAASMGANVLAMDYEDEVVDSILEANDFSAKVTPVHMNFNEPTPSLGPALAWGNSFQRFSSDIVIAIGLIHHICITQQIPVFLFCQTIMKYAEKGIILEFVDPEDKHVKSWKKSIPKDYDIETIKYFLKNKFPNSKIKETSKEDGVNRTFIYFSKNL